MTPRVLLVPELLFLVTESLRASEVLQLALVSRGLAEKLLPVLNRAPQFDNRHNNNIALLLADKSRRILKLVRILDVSRLTHITDPSLPNPAAAWLAQTKIAHQLISACPNLQTLKMDGFPSDVTGTLFANLLLSIPPNIECIIWTRVAVSDAHLSKMVDRWRNLKSFEVGIVTPFMWGVIRSAISGPSSSPQFNILSLNGVGGATAAANYGGPDWAAPTNSNGLSTFLATSIYLTSLKIQPLPGDDGTVHLLKVLTSYAPPSLKRLTLGRGRYLTATQTSATGLWKQVLHFIISKSNIEYVSVTDPFETCRRYCLPAWCLSESFFNEAVRKIRKRHGQKDDARTHKALEDLLRKELTALFEGDGSLERLVKINNNVGLRWFLDSNLFSSSARDSPLNDTTALFEILPQTLPIIAELNNDDEGDLHLVPQISTIVRQSGMLEPVVFTSIGIGILKELVVTFGESDFLKTFSSSSTNAL